MTPGEPPIPPQDLDAEEHVLGAILLASAAGLDAGKRTVDAIRAATGLEGEHFYRESHARFFVTVVELAAGGSPTDAISVAAELTRRGELDDVGGKVRVHELAALCPAVSNADHWARIVIRKARDRELLALLAPLVEALFDGTVDEEGASARLAEAVTLLTPEVEFKPAGTK